MARERASIGVEIWGDSDFRDLTPPAQALYFKLVTSPRLDYCGVVDFHPGRLSKLSREQSVLDVMVAAQELSAKHWCVFDQDTDEVLVRGFIRHDQVLKQPKLAVSAAKAYAAIGSNKIRAVIVHEILRYQAENPDLTAWDGAQMKSLLRQQAVSAKDLDTELLLPFDPTAPRPTDQGHGQTIDEQIDQAHDHAETHRYGQRLPQTLGKATTGLTPAPTPAPAPAPGSNDPNAHAAERETAPDYLTRGNALGVDFLRVRARLDHHAGETVAPDVAWQLVREVIGNARPKAGDRTGLIVTHIDRHWPEVSQRIYAATPAA